MKDQDNLRKDVGAGQQIREREVKKRRGCRSNEREWGSTPRQWPGEKEAVTFEWTHSPETESFSFMQRRAEVQKEREQRDEDSELQIAYLLSHIAGKQLLPL